MKNGGGVGAVKMWAPMEVEDMEFRQKEKNLGLEALLPYLDVWGEMGRKKGLPISEGKFLQAKN